MEKEGWLDRTIARVAPIYAMKRQVARRAMEVANSGYGNYGASLHKKSMRGWSWAGGSAKEDIEDNLDTLRERSRDAYMGVPVATAALKTLRTNVIAGGLVPVPQVDGEALGLDEEETEGLQNQILREFSLWADTPSCDADRVDDFYKLQQLAFLSYAMNGDAVALFGFRESIDQPYGLTVRLVEADRVCSPNGFDRLSPCTVNGHKVHRIVQGVETDETGTVAAYWISEHHPLSAQWAYQGEGQSWHRIEAYGSETGRRNLAHIMTRERAGQVRGVPILAPVLEELKQLGRYTEAEIDAAVISSMFTVFLQKESATDGTPFGEMLPPDQQVDSMDKGSVELGPGAFVDLQPGESVAFADPKHPNAGFDAFSYAMTKQIGGALEIPIEVMEKHFSTSYSAARGALNEFWRTCGMYRDWFVTDFCQPVYEEWFAEAVARGRIQAPGFFTDPARRKAYLGCTWNGPARTNLNPVQEVEAALKRVEAGFSTAQEETAQMTGGNYNSNIRQRKAEARRKREVDEIGEGEKTE